MRGTAILAPFGIALMENWNTLSDYVKIHLESALLGGQDKAWREERKEMRSVADSRKLPGGAWLHANASIPLMGVLLVGTRRVLQARLRANS